MRHYRPALLLLFALTAASCESTPTSPALATDGLDVSIATTPTGARQEAPMLARLFGQAIAKVKAEKGEATAMQIAEEHRRLLAAARSARAAGDTAAARRNIGEARASAARVVVRVFPQAPQRVIGMVDENLATLNRRIATAEAAGEDVVRVKAAAQRIQRLHGAATNELRNGRPVPALVHATDAVDLLARIRRR